MTQAFSGCDRCGYVGRTYGYRDGVLCRRDCPRCGEPLAEVGLGHARALARRRRGERGFTERVRSQLAELDRDRDYDARMGPSSAGEAGSAG
jgi:hypothetical protein